MPASLSQRITTIFERGTAAARSDPNRRVCAGGDHQPPELRDTEPAIALGFCQL